MHLRRRYVSPALGQFVSLDPLEVFNRYAYVNANPINSVDPSGLLLGFGGSSSGGGGSIPKSVSTPTKPKTTPVNTCNYAPGAGFSSSPQSCGATSTSNTGGQTGGNVGFGTGQTGGASGGGNNVGSSGTGATTGSTQANSQGTQGVSSYDRYIPPEAQSCGGQPTSATINAWLRCRETLGQNTCPPGYQQLSVGGMCKNLTDKSTHFSTEAWQQKWFGDQNGALWRETLPGVTDWIFENLVNSPWSQAIRNEPLAAGALLLAGGLALLSIPLTGGASTPFVAKLTLDGLTWAGTYVAGTAAVNTVSGKSDRLEGVTFGALVANALLGAALNQAIRGTDSMYVPADQAAQAQFTNTVLKAMMASIINTAIIGLSDNDPSEGELVLGMGLGTIASLIGGRRGIAAAIVVNGIITALDPVDFSKPSQGRAGFG